MSALKPGLTNAEMVKVVFHAIHELRKTITSTHSPWEALQSAAHVLFPEKKLTWKNIDLAIQRHHATKTTYPEMIAVSLLFSMERLLLGTLGEVDRLQAENQQLRETITALMPGDAGHDW